MEKLYKNLTPDEKKIMDLLGYQEIPDQKTLKSIKTIVKAEIAETPYFISESDITIVCCYGYYLGRIHGIRSERKKKRDKGGKQ